MSDETTFKGVSMIEAEATAEMLLMTGRSISQSTTGRSTAIVRTVLDGKTIALVGFMKYAPLVHGVLLARVPRDGFDDLVQDIFSTRYASCTRCATRRRLVHG
jgi:hypothetical protein